MATNTISDLRHEVTSRLQEIVACVGVSHDSDLVEELEEIQKHVNLLDWSRRKKAGKVLIMKINA